MTKTMPATGLAVLLLLAGSDLVSGGSGPGALAAQTAGQDPHIIFYQEHIARLELIRFNCR
jgi:hypothetical protein